VAGFVVAGVGAFSMISVCFAGVRWCVSQYDLSVA
jgi:hypothetical protein